MNQLQRILHFSVDLPAVMSCIQPHNQTSSHRLMFSGSSAHEKAMHKLLNTMAMNDVGLSVVESSTPAVSEHPASEDSRPGSCATTSKTISLDGSSIERSVSPRGSYTETQGVVAGRPGCWYVICSWITTNLKLIVRLFPFGRTCRIRRQVRTLTRPTSSNVHDVN